MRKDLALTPLATVALQESELADDKRRLRQHIKEQELSGVELLKQFRLENAKEVSKLRQDFELQASCLSGCEPRKGTCCRMIQGMYDHAAKMTFPNVQ